jgi:hypothetical protein
MLPASEVVPAEVETEAMTWGDMGRSFKNVCIRISGCKNLAIQLL